MSNTKRTIVTILVHYNNEKECISLLQELNKLPVTNHHVVVVDNQSKPSSFSALKTGLENIKCDIVQNPINGGYGSGMNLGFMISEKHHADYVQILNTDVSISNSNYLNEIIELMERDLQIGLIGPAVCLRDGSIQNTRLPQVSFKNAIFYRKASVQLSHIEASHQLYATDVINGVCMIIRAKAFKDIGGFDSSFFMYGEEHDLCYRLRQNAYKICFWSGKSIVHFEEHNTKLSKTITWRYLLVRANQVFFLQKHQNTISSLTVSLLFSLALLLKSVKRYQFESFSLCKSIYYLFRPQKLNEKLKKQ